MAAAGDLDARANPPDEGTRRRPRWQLQLLDSWSVCHEGVPVPMRSREQRVVALLGLHGARPRKYVAGLLWPESTDAHAAGSLRAAVWKIDQVAPGLLTRGRAHIGLTADARIDVRELIEAATDVLDRRIAGTDQLGLARALRAVLRGDLLPGWYDDWVLLERSQVQQLRQQALERLAYLLSEAGDAVAALRAAQAAIAVEPLRESAHRSLITVQMRAGNHSDAVRHYEIFRTQIESELGITPSEQLELLVRPVVARASVIR